MYNRVKIMKRTLIKEIPCALPGELERIAFGARIYDSSCSSEAKVYFIDKDEGYYLKIAKAQALRSEAEMTSYFHSKSLGAEVLHYGRFEENDMLLTAKVGGEDCTHETYLADPERICDTIAYELRRLHEIDYTGCPVMQRTVDYLKTAKENYRRGTYDKSAFPDSFGYRSAEEAMEVLMNGKDSLRCDTLLHGDYCLPNIMLDRWRFSGFIDLGGGGVGDRHIDLFWGAWTLMFNLKTDKYRERFLDAYGRDKVDESVLKIVAAAEVFG